MYRDPVTVSTVTLLVIEGRKGKNLKYVFRWNKGTFLHCIVGMNQAIAEKDLEISFFHIYHVIHKVCTIVREYHHTVQLFVNFTILHNCS